MRSSKISEFGIVSKAAAERQKNRRRSGSRAPHSQDPKRFSLPVELKRKIMDYFATGKYSISEVAVACGVSYSTAKRYIEKDPVLKEAWETSFNQTLDNVVEAMADRAIGARNEIAAQQAGEFLLRYHRKEQYSDKSSMSDMAKSLPRIVVPLIVQRDKNSIPQTALDLNRQEDVIDV